MLFFFVFISIGFGCPVNNKTEYLNCFSNIFDINHDEIITENEIDTTISTHFNLATYATNGSQILKICDINNDNVLTVLGDWNYQNSCLFNINSINAIFVCEICKMFGWNMSVNK